MEPPLITNQSASANRHAHIRKPQFDRDLLTGGDFSGHHCAYAASLMSVQRPGKFSGTPERKAIKSRGTLIGCRGKTRLGSLSNAMDGAALIRLASAGIENRCHAAGINRLENGDAALSENRSSKYSGTLQRQR